MICIPILSDTQAVLSVQIAFHWCTLQNGALTGMQRSVIMFLTKDLLVEDVGKQNGDGIQNGMHNPHI